MWFDGWFGVLKTLTTGVFGYLALVVLLRVSGKRTLSKMNAFDLVVTVALGSSLATIALSKDVQLLEGVTCLLVLIGLQLAAAWLSVRSAKVRTLLKAQPSLLFHRGAFLDTSMTGERVTRDEVYAAMRSSGVERVEDVDAVVLETDGSFTVLTGGARDVSTLAGVKGFTTREAGPPT